MQETVKEKNVVKACCVDGRLEMFQEMATALDKCQKSLSDFLDSKRNSFPRFFFISDDEMLSVLGSSDVTAVQEHCLKMFDNCQALIFKRQNKFVGGMRSPEGESYEFRTLTSTEGPVEFWMTDVVKEMVASLRAIMKEGIFHYPKMSRLKWIEENLGMVVNGASKLWWTWQVEDGFKKVKTGEKYAIKNLLSQLTKQLNDLVYETRKELSSAQRKKVNTLIIIDVHARDIIDSFVRDSILDDREFAWESQLRFYWIRNEDDLFAKQCTYKTAFGYEYMGLNGRLVITPLTDRCYMTLTQALSFRLGGAPAGPAGTGKTETTKDLAKAMTLYCVVFNCGDGLDYKAMASIFSGLVQVMLLFPYLTLPYLTSSRASCRWAPGAASTSSTASRHRCSRWSPRSSRRCSRPSSPTPKPASLKVPPLTPTPTCCVCYPMGVIPTSQARSGCGVGG